MACGDKKRFNCGDGKTYAACTIFEGELPAWSELDTCVDINETTQELYDKTTEILAALDLTDLADTCIEIDKEGVVVTLKSFADTILRELTALKCPETTPLTTADIDITNFELDLKCLVTDCGDDITKLSEALQALITKYCDEDSVAQTLINSGAVSLINKNTLVQTTTASALTLAAGREGQTKFIKMTVDGGDAVIGCPTLQGGTSITLNDLGDFIQLYFAGGKWNIIVNSGCTIA
jgi:hypothetical protein